MNKNLVVAIVVFIACSLLAAYGASEAVRTQHNAPEVMLTVFFGLAAIVLPLCIILAPQSKRGQEPEDY